jgi:hypothetical protein
MRTTPRKDNHDTQDQVTQTNIKTDTKTDTQDKTPIICSWSGGMLRSPYTVAEEENTIFLQLRQEKIRSDI